MLANGNGNDGKAKRPQQSLLEERIGIVQNEFPLLEEMARSVYFNGDLQGKGGKGDMSEVWQ